MKYRKVGKTGIEVSQICLGTMTFGTPVQERDAISIVKRAVDSGINFIDTANMYEGYARTMGSPGGISEKILGKALKGIRDKVIIATKVGAAVGSEPDDRGLGRTHVLREIDRSLKRLKTDYVDFYYMHLPDDKTPIRESISIFNRLIKEGKIRYYGISNFTVDNIKNMLFICEEDDFIKPVIAQPPYSLLRRGIEKEQLPLYIKEGISIVPYQVLQGGILTGKYKRRISPPEDSRKAEKPQWIPFEFNDILFNKLEALEELAKKANMTMAEYVVLWTLSLPGIVSVLIGVKRFEQLEDFLSVPDKFFPENDIKKINKIFKENN